MKISANELRLCNYVNDNWQRSNEPLQLNEMEFKVRVLQLNCKDLSPIPLNEQWIKNWGINYATDLHVKGRIYYSFEKDILVQFFKNGRIDVRISGRKFTFEKQKLYVHQLQNLYFALTGKELTK